MDWVLYDNGLRHERVQKCCYLSSCSNSCCVYFIQQCLKCVSIRSFSCTYFPTFGLNIEIYFVNLRIQSECGKIWTTKTPNTDTFYAVEIYDIKTTIALKSCNFPFWLLDMFYEHLNVMWLLLDHLWRQLCLKGLFFSKKRVQFLNIK